MSADSTTRAGPPSVPGGSLSRVGHTGSQPWLRRLAVLAALLAALFGFREWMLAQNAKRYGLPR